MVKKTEFLKKYILEMAICALLYVCSFAASRNHIYWLAALLLLALAAGVFISRFRRTGNLADMKGLFALAWIGGQGIACLQLSRLQTDWNWKTWAVFFLAYAGFSLGFSRRKPAPEKKALESDERMAGRLLLCICVLTVLSWICFLTEFLAVGFIPLFSDMPHAYSYFHVSGVHYFTISCILIPAMSVIFYRLKEKKKAGEWLLLSAGNLTAVAVPVLCVSRFQLLFAVGFAVVVYILMSRKLNWKILLLLIVVMIPAYAGLTVARNHDVAYLNGIFEMKNRHMPIFISQPYIYVANNYENFNCLVEQVTSHTHGIRMLFPVFALTGLKFVFPELVSTQTFITKTELTTLTMFYDAYYDFGAAGVFVFSLVLGLAAGKITEKIRLAGNPVIYLLYGQIAIYLGLSFFTTWFSNPTTWFWIALTAIMYVFIGYRKKGSVHNEA